MIITLLAVLLCYPQPEAKKPVGLTAAIAEAARFQKQRRAEIEYGRAIQRAHDAWQADQMCKSRQLLDSVPWEPRGWEWNDLRPPPRK